MAKVDDDIWAFWPDNYMCPVDELEEHLDHRSDDYQLVTVTAYDEAGEPSRWFGILPGRQDHEKS